MAKIVHSITIIALADDEPASWVIPVSPISQPDGGDRQPDPLPAPEVKSEESLGEHRQEHEPGGKDHLHHRQRR
jgi:hypothetical protein